MPETDAVFSNVEVRPGPVNGMVCPRTLSIGFRACGERLAYDLANFLRTLALPAEVAQWSMTTLRDKLVKVGAKIVRPWPVDHLSVGRDDGAALPAHSGSNR